MTSSQEYIISNPSIWDLKYEITLMILLVAALIFIIWHFAYKEGQESMRFNPPV